MPLATPNPNLRFSLAGLQAGMSGGLVMLAWLAVSSLWYRHSIWSVPNLLSSTFYGDAAFRAGFGRTTYAGVALHLFIYSVLGVLFGLMARNGNGRLLLLLSGLFFGLIWYYLLFGPIWKSFNPLVALYVPNRSMLAGHLLYGVMLGRYPRFRELVLRPVLQQAAGE